MVAKITMKLSLVMSPKVNNWNNVFVLVTNHLI